MKKTLAVGLLVAAVLAAAAPVCASEKVAKAPKEPKRAHGALRVTPAMELRNSMRMLWEEHVAYTRNYIISGLAGLEDAGPVAERLLRNQDDIGNAIKPFYGEEAGAKLSALLREHIQIATDVVKAAKSGDKGRLGPAQDRWRKNGDDIAVYLAGVSPIWPLQALKDAMAKHLELTTAEVVARVKKDWAADIDAYDKGHAHALTLADALADGIIKQFPRQLHK
jgi:hypothetical protein